MRWTGLRRIGIAAGVAAALAGWTATATVIITHPETDDFRPIFTPIEQLPADVDAAKPVAVSDDGAVVIGNGISDRGDEAFRWTAATGAVGLGALPGGLWASSRATHASRDGSVVVGTSLAAEGFVPFRWTETHGMERLLPAGSSATCEPTAATPDASMVVIACESFASPGVPPGIGTFVWSVARGVEWLPTSAEVLRYSDVSDDGGVLVGGSMLEVVRLAAGSDGRFGTADDVRMVVGTPSLIGAFPKSWSASADGNVIVVGRREFFTGWPDTLLWSAGADRVAGTADDVRTDLIDACEGTGISDDGRTVIGRCQGFGGALAPPARWTQGHGWRRLFAALPEGTDAAAAVASSRDGSVIVGWISDASSPTVPPGERIVRTFRWTAATGASFFTSTGREVDGQRPQQLALSRDGAKLLGPEWGPRGEGLLLWQAGRGRRHIDDLDGGAVQLEPQALSADGRVLVGQLRSSAGFQALRWSGPGSVRAIGPASRAEWETRSSVAGSIVVAGYPSARVLGGYPDPSAAPFRWRQSSGRATPIALPKPFPACWLETLSKDGTAISGRCRSAHRRWSFVQKEHLGTVKAPGTGLYDQMNCEVSALTADGARAALRCAASPTTGEIALWTPANGRTRKVALGVAGDPTLVALSDDGRRMLVSVKNGGADPLWLLWTEGVGAELLPIPVDATWIRGLRLSADGSTVLLRTATEHLRYRSGLGLELVPRPIGSALQPDSVAFLSADGRVVAGFDPMPPGSNDDPAPPPPRVWVSDPRQGGRWLDEIITSQTGEDLDGWELERLVGMSADGTRFAGTDSDATGWRGAWHAVIPDLAPPAP